MKVLITIFFCALYAVLNVTGAAVIKSQLKLVQLDGPKDFMVFLLKPMVIIGFGIIMASALVMFKALKSAEFSFVVPVSTGVNFVLTVLIGVIFFKDKVAAMQYAGLAMILAGIMLMSLARTKSDGQEKNTEAHHTEQVEFSEKF